MPIKASELINRLKEHIDNHGDDHVMILDMYEVVYKTFSYKQLSRNDGKFIIECKDERD